MSSTSPEKSYTSLFYNYLKGLDGKGDLTFANLSMPGDTSTDLLTKISTNDTVKVAIKNVDEITISIGGNNLLGPVIAAIGAAFNVNPVNNPKFAQEVL